MARLEEITQSLNAKLPESKKIQLASVEKNCIGKKRRDWLSESGTDNKSEEKSYIHPIHQPHSSTPFINPIHQPLNEKGLMNGVYKPLIITLEKLRGNPLKITQYIFELTRNEKEKTTGKTTQTQIMEKLGISKDSVRTAIRFLLRNGLLIRVVLVIGKSGWSKYRLEDSLFSELDKAYKKGNIDPLNRSEKKGSISSSYINTTTEREGENFLEFSLNFDSLIKHGFTENHFKQLKKIDFISKELLQDSIDHFAFDLEMNNKTKEIKTNPVSYFMGIMRRDGVYNAPSNYVSPREAALKQYKTNKDKEEERLKEFLEIDYRSYRDQEIKKLYLSLSEEEKNHLKEACENQIGGGLRLKVFKELGLDDDTNLSLFSDFVTDRRINSFRTVLSFKDFCGLKVNTGEEEG